MNPNTNKNSLVILKAGRKLFPNSATNLLEIMHKFIAYNICQWDREIEELLDAKVRNVEAEQVQIDDLANHVLDGGALKGGDSAGWGLHTAHKRGTVLILARLIYGKRRQVLGRQRGDPAGAPGQDEQRGSGERCEQILGQFHGVDLSFW